MSGADTFAVKFRRFLEEQPGRPQSRGGSIPDKLHEQILRHAAGITQTVWGRNPTPAQVQWLHDNGHHDREQIEAAFQELPHPHAPSLKVGEYSAWHDAARRFRRLQQQ